MVLTARFVMGLALLIVNVRMNRTAITNTNAAAMRKRIGGEGMDRYNLNLKYENKTQEQILRALNAEASTWATKRRPSWTMWQFWVGFAWGAILIASMDFGDVHFCVGSCYDVSAFRIGGQP